MMRSRIKIPCIIFAFLIAFSFLFLISCSEEVTTKNELTKRSKNLNVFSVNFLSVGQGDCAFIIFPDGKTMLIDCGEKDDNNFSTIKEYIDATGGERIDYLVLSHTDSDHTGNAAEIIKKYGVSTAYLPKVINEEKFTAYYNAKNELISCGANIKISAIGERVFGEDYFFCFLYPDEDMGYDGLNYGDETANEINAVSSILYLDYRGTRFIFTGDADKKSEGKVVENAMAGLYYIYGKNGFSVDLNGMDYLKVSHHGGKEEINERFYKYLMPKNAVFSVSALNNYGHPSQYTLNSLEIVNPKINILRTDVLGSISVVFSETGSKIITDVDVNE